ncbi:MAG: sugar phosphate isomerase/epimerase [Selenomonadaceae bacterium]|nr:sugar phosphate isomerase/epimerase [Selenomonadaceae bacterium]
MELVCRSSGIVAAEYPRQGIGDVAKAGFGEMMLDLSSYCLKQDMEDFGTNKKKRRSAEVLTDVSLLEGMVQKAAEHCRQCGLGVTSMYGPVLRRDTKREDLNGLLEKLTGEGIRLCGRYGAAYLVVPPLFSGVGKGDLWEVNRAFYLRLAKIAGEESVGILLENQARDVHGHLVRGICSDEQEAAHWVDELNAACGEDRFGFCLDAGTASLCGQNMYEFVKMIGKRLKMVILRDVDGREDAALLPFTGVGKGQSKTDWLNLVRGLRETSFDGKAVISLEGTASSFSPLLRPQLLDLAKAVGDYICWQVDMERVLAQYDRRVLFGAGNMCRAYMKCYGEAYPPLFTCDNNREMWGTEFCGLAVRSPEELRKLPGDCAIFICNIYYREIEQQLREMGLGNPILFFNDEYLPSFHFDRLEDMAEKTGKGSEG